MSVAGMRARAPRAPARTRRRDRLLLASWVAFSLVPLAGLARRVGVMEFRFAAASCLSLAGAWLLHRALRRDVELATLGAFLRSPAGRLVSLTGVIALIVLASQASLILTTTAAMGVASTLFALWGASGSARSLSGKCGRALMLTVSIGVAFAVCEAVLRIPAVADRVLPRAHRIAHEWHAADYDESSFRPWRGQTFRSFHLQDRATKAGPRIVVLGDSFTWGDKIEDTSEIWPYVLERELSERAIPSRVFNLAHLGDTTVNELEYLQEFGWELQPDVVLVQYLANDPLPSGPRFQRKSAGWMVDEVIPLGLSRHVHKTLDARSYFYSLANDRWQHAARSLFNLRNLSYHDLHEEGFPPWEATKAAIRRMAAESRANDTPLLFVMMPLFLRGADLADHPHAPIHEKLASFLEGEGIPFLDLLPVYAEAHPVPEHWHALTTDEHPNAEAHRLAGRTIAGWMEQMEVIPGASRRAPDDRSGEGVSRSR